MDGTKPSPSHFLCGFQASHIGFQPFVSGCLASQACQDETLSPIPLQNTQDELYHHGILAYKGQRVVWQPIDEDIATTHDYFYGN